MGNPDECTRVHLPPQMFSWSFDQDGRCYKMTGGYCVDRAVGDSKGLGGFFGVLQAVLGKTGLPFPEGQPWTKETRSLNWEVFSLRLPQIVQEWRKAFGEGPSAEGLR